MKLWLRCPGKFKHTNVGELDKEVNYLKKRMCNIQSNFRSNATQITPDLELVLFSQAVVQVICWMQVKASGKKVTREKVFRILVVLPIGLPYAEQMEEAAASHD